MWGLLRKKLNWADILKDIAEFGGIGALGVFLPGKQDAVILLFLVVVIAKLADIFD